MQRSKVYIIGFAAIICIVSSAVISITAIGLQSKKELNVELDRKKKILNAVGLSEKVAEFKKSDEILAFYDRSISSVVVSRDGSIVPGKSVESLEDGDEDLPVYVLKQNGHTQAIAIPVEGKGLWSTLYGYFALESDVTTVRGITFYKHGETPGLGGEIEKPWFQNNFVGKKIFDQSGNLKPVRVIKGKVAEMITDKTEQAHAVDGISGATITSKGVTSLLKNWLSIYEPFLRKARQKGLDNVI